MRLYARVQIPLLSWVTNFEFFGPLAQFDLLEKEPSCWYDVLPAVTGGMEFDETALWLFATVSLWQIYEFYNESVSDLDDETLVTDLVSKANNNYNAKITTFSSVIFAATYVGVIPALIFLSPVDIVEFVITQAADTTGIFNLQEFHSLLKGCGGLASNVTFSDFQKLVEVGYQDYMALRMKQGTFAIPELLWTHQVCFNQLSIPMNVFNDCYIYTGVREIFIAGNGAANALLDMYTHLGQYIGGAPGMPILEFKSLVVEHFINFLNYTYEAHGKEEAMKMAEEGVHLFKELKLPAEQLSRVLEAVAKL